MGEGDGTVGSFAGFAGTIAVAGAAGVEASHALVGVGGSESSIDTVPFVAHRADVVRGAHHAVVNLAGQTHPPEILKSAGARAAYVIPDAAATVGHVANHAGRTVSTEGESRGAGLAHVDGRGSADVAIVNGAPDYTSGAEEDESVETLLADAVGAVDAVLHSAVVETSVVEQRVPAHADPAGRRAGAGLAELGAVGLDVAGVGRSVKSKARVADCAGIGELAKRTVRNNIRAGVAALLVVQKGVAGIAGLADVVLVALRAVASGAGLAGSSSV